MTKLNSLTLFLIITLCSCAQKPATHKPDPVAVQLNNQAMMLVRYMDNADSSGKAIALLDRATSIDSNYFLGHYNKLMFYYQLKQFDKAIATNNKLLQLNPNAHDLYLRGGMMYELLGDTIASKSYFKKSLAICNVVLDTMNRENRDFDMLTINQAINYVMLNDGEKANRILKELYDSQPDKPVNNHLGKDIVLQFMNKNKKELLELMLNPGKTG